MPKAAKSSSRASASRANPVEKKSSSTKPSKGGKAASNGNATVKTQLEKTTAQADAPPNGKVEEANYLLMVMMTLSSDPTITRILSLPPSLTFAKLHQVLQIAFGWANCHMHEFRVEVPETSE